MRTGTIRLSPEELLKLREDYFRGYSPPVLTYDRLFFTIEEMTKEAVEMAAALRSASDRNRDLRTLVEEILKICAQYRQGAITVAGLPDALNTVIATYCRGQDIWDVRMPIPMLLTCPMCGTRHIDVGEFATKPHHTHACQKCGLVWRPALVHTVGVEFLPGFKNLSTAEPQTGSTWIDDEDRAALRALWNACEDKPTATRVGSVLIRLGVLEKG